ncbi:MAG: Endochitinase 1 [Tremellales sp. Tagirdzhanova-0007]|nr:MAG: Endochitinase 1 [Tremellales sp. Tagirdzhanova-0007]
MSLSATQRGIYGREFPPQKIPFQHLTHINYAFAKVDRQSGGVTLSDPWADVEIHFEGDRWDEQGKNLYGCFKAIYLMKKKNRQQPFRDVVDWRMVVLPATAPEAESYVQLLHELRHGLEQLALSKKRGRGQYQLTVAAPCGASNMSMLRIADMDRVLDFWNLMAYDFAGSWDPVANHQANLSGTESSNLPSVDKAVKHYLSHGVKASKLVVGMPLYGRAFADTSGPGSAYSGVGKGSWEDGIWDYKVLPQPGAQEFNRYDLGASFSYDPPVDIVPLCHKD